MIGQLSGEIIHKAPPLLVIDVQGVGYEVLCPMSSFYQLGNASKQILLTHLVIRDDAHSLYGFVTEAERYLFRQLIKVNGIGPKVALAILSFLPVQELVTYIVNGDFSQIKKVPGIGLKTAQKLVVELKDTLEKSSIVTAGSHVQGNVRDDEQAILALKSLGFALKEINAMLAKLPNEPLSTEQIIKLALQNK